MSKLVIDQMYAFVATDKNGDEGIIGMNTADGWLPLVGADMERIDSLKRIAREAGIQAQVKVKLIKFSAMEVLEEL